MITRNLETSVSVGLDPGLVFADGAVEKHFVDSVPLGELCHDYFAVDNSSNFIILANKKKLPLK